jgi:hypothetical protein
MYISSCQPSLTVMILQTESNLFRNSVESLWSTSGPSRRGKFREIFFFQTKIREFVSVPTRGALNLLVTMRAFPSLGASAARAIIAVRRASEMPTYLAAFGQMLTIKGVVFARWIPSPEGVDCTLFGAQNILTLKIQRKR